MSRIESASSINTYLHCPRQYYYSYKESLPRSESIATITGKVIHSTLENFYNLSVNGISKEDYMEKFQERLVTLFNQEWAASIPKLLNLGIEKADIQKYYSDALGMLHNFASKIISEIEDRMTLGEDFEKAFNSIKPETELFIESPEYKIRGYIDAVHETNGEITLIDYKTSKRDIVTPEYLRQLSIYALLYSENFNKVPKDVGLYFIRTGTTKKVKADESLLTQAKMDCKTIHEKTVSDNIEDYPRNLGPHCNGKFFNCDFYDVCFGNKTKEEFIKEKTKED